MKLTLDQLAKHLQQHLAPIYLISGDDALQCQEAITLIRQQADKAGYLGRERFSAQRGFDWSSFLSAVNSLSLFDHKRVIDLHLVTGKPGDKGSKALQYYANNPPKDTVLMISTPKLDRATQKSKWFNALTSKGVFLPIWPIPHHELPRWISRRLQEVNLQTTKEGLQLLVERSEGNLLAANQAISKLSLLYGNGKLSTHDVAAAVTDSARFDIFKLVDYALLGQTQHCLRVLIGLQQEGVEPILILWALAKEIRTLNTLCAAQQQGASLQQAFTQAGVWTNRKPLLQRVLKRTSSAQLRHLLHHAAEIDAMIKGLKRGNCWDALDSLVLSFAGHPLPETRDLTL